MNLKNIKTSQKNVPILPYANCIAKMTDEGKTGISVEQHCINVANVATKLAELFPKIKYGPQLAALHDVGKISPGFQKKYFNNYLKEKCPELAKISSSNFCENHAEISEATVREFLKEFLDESSSGEIVGIHHGMRKLPQANNTGVYGGKDWAEERLRFIQSFTEKYGQLPERNDLPPEQKAVLAGFVTVSDWLGSDGDFFPADRFDEKVCSKSAVKALASCGFRNVTFNSKLSFEEVFGFSPRNSQKAFFETVNQPGVYILEAETGSGKTEAALYAAYKMLAKGGNRGLYFALPTRLTSDRIHERVQDFADKICEIRTPVMLSYGSAWLNDEVMKIIKSGGEEFSGGGSWFNPAKRTLLAPFGVGTVDQALMSVMNVKHYTVRAFGLAGKVVILDEVHSYDMYTGTILDKLIEALRKMGCTVIILSATLTKKRKKSLLSDDLPENNGYPLITSCYNDIIRAETTNSVTEKKIKIQFNYTSSTEKIAELAISKAEKGECVLWIKNTVMSAQNVYKKIESMKIENAFEVGLLHSRFTVERRKMIEEEWIEKLETDSKNQPKGCILVATQVVEQSVDIDADFLITELAPIDMLIQRFGRLWRHDRCSRLAEEPSVFITTGQIGDANSKEALIETIGKNNSMIYATYILWKTWNVLKNRERISIPGELREILEATYRHDKNIPYFVNELFVEMQTRRNKLRQEARGPLTGVTMPTLNDDENRPPTRYSDLPTVDCLLIKDIDSIGNEANLTMLNDELLKVNENDKNLYISKQLHRNIVSIARYNFKNMDLKVPRYLRKHFYGELALLIVKSDGSLTLDGSPTQLFYQKNWGIYREKDFQKDEIIDNNNFNTGEWDYESCEW
ncbi:MAG: CRISPR-associated helicase Cas3' [Verrucomicrobiota bacterium]|nr:CRISPR-associated helicase Cas3' [Verrucomicrobiota bacterium]